MDIDSLPSDRKRWPFSKMRVGETMPIKNFQGKTKTYVQRMITNYAHSSGKKFKTKTSDGILYVKRIS